MASEAKGQLLLAPNHELPLVSELIPHPNCLPSWQEEAGLNLSRSSNYVIATFHWGGGGIAISISSGGFLKTRKLIILEGA